MLIPKAALAALAVASLAPAASAQESDTDPCTAQEQGNGFCTDAANTAACNWDGGDCCESTCQSSLFTCGFNGFNGTFSGYSKCIDPSVSVCVVPDDNQVGNGFCNVDGGYNTAACDWDGGDCCDTTCESTGDNVCGQVPDGEGGTLEIGFRNCLNPSICTVADTSLLGNGFCNSGNTSAYNTEACDWDGGDCCESTCESTAENTCGEVSDSEGGTQVIGFRNCLDPSICFVADEANLGNGFCNGQDYNTEVCGWDGGDCCSDSCDDSESDLYTCGYANEAFVGFPQCADPDYVVTTPGAPGTTTAAPCLPTCEAEDCSPWGNGRCDSDFNNANCDWDGGDCCEFTCRDGDINTCGVIGNLTIGFPECIDPDSQVPEICEANVTRLRDSMCDLPYNTELCNWDGGDCCATTCDGEFCGLNSDGEDVGFRTCAEPGVCTVSSSDTLGNALCNADANNELCNWDGGDCCSNTCEDTDTQSCGYNADGVEIGFLTCQDPANQCDVEALGDGLCEPTFNNDLCNWDGGDCCEDSCVDSTYQCGFDQTGDIETGFLQCVDPANQLCVVPDSSSLGNGYCDNDLYNNADCGWDGGDCCEFTCTSTDDNQCGYDRDGVEIGFVRCLDPDVLALGSCLVDNPEFVGDGKCDSEGGYNTEMCNWDGGDCCYLTCNRTAANECGYTSVNINQTLTTRYVGFNDCQNPNTCSGVADYAAIGDARCDTDSNNALCNWDGGDCCEDSCISNADTTCGYSTGPDGESIEVGFRTCSDPIFAPRPANLVNCSAPIVTSYGDGICDNGIDTEYFLNSAECDWDGGDCCIQTCGVVETPPGPNATAETTLLDGAAESCQSAYLECRDPSILDRYPNCTADHLSFVGDGYCDEGSPGYNTEACSWDGGDCCLDTCRDSNGGALHACGDPEYVCVDPTSVGSTVCPEDPDKRASQGDGRCDMSGTSNSGNLNNEKCGWDGGDCCPSTCSVPATSADGEAEACEDLWYACLDPEASDFGAVGECVVQYSSYIGDGSCDEGDGMYNTLRCGWDGGDCCSSTCEPINFLTNYDCEGRAKYCLDPDAAENANAPVACRTLPWSHVGDGYCDESGNTELCGWDGGDCCPDTCEVVVVQPSGNATLERCPDFADNVAEKSGSATNSSIPFDIYFFCEDPDQQPNTTTTTTTTPPIPTRPPNPFTDVDDPVNPTTTADPGLVVPVTTTLPPVELSTTDSVATDSVATSTQGAIAGSQVSTGAMSALLSISSVSVAILMTFLF